MQDAETQQMGLISTSAVGTTDNCVLCFSAGELNPALRRFRLAVHEKKDVRHCEQGHILVRNDQQGPDCSIYICVHVWYRTYPSIMLCIDLHYPSAGCASRHGLTAGTSRYATIVLVKPVS